MRGEWGARGLRSGGKSGSSGPNVYRITPGAVNLIPPCPEAATLAPLPPPFSDTPSVLLLLDFGPAGPKPKPKSKALARLFVPEEPFHCLPSSHFTQKTL